MLFALVLTVSKNVPLAQYTQLVLLTQDKQKLEHGKHVFMLLTIIG